MRNAHVPLRVGDLCHGYRVRRLADLPLLHGTYIELLHEPTGARHVHIARPDDNNVFAVTFPTIPSDSTGVAHILEHIVLSGSRRFPVRDPFFAMLPRSLATFMNAMTSETWTAYPFATRNEKDFYNLLDVYLDACFFPNLDEYSFLQEGHRLEFTDPDDSSTPLRYTGVVYNEMKGAMATAPNRMARAVAEALFPDLPYAFNSGGEPRHIPELTAEALRRFHAEHYHPSNAYFYTYGDLPLETTLERIEDTVLSHFEHRAIDVRIPDQPTFPAPRAVAAPYPLAAAENDGRKSQVLVAWRTVPVADSFATLAFEVLEDVLLGSEAAPLRRALIESRLGKALADGTGFDTATREAVFAAGLKDIAAADAEAVEELILTTLRRLVAEGLDPELVDGAMHGVEIDSREVSNAGAPYGLKLLFSIAGAYLYDGDPQQALLLEENLARLAAERSKGRFFEDLIDRTLLQNPHRVRILLTPDDQLTAREEAEEAQRAAAVRERLTDEEVSRIVARAQELRVRQQSPGDVSCLPTLTLGDIPVEYERIPQEMQALDGGCLGLFAQPTNGLTYVDIAFDVAHLSDEELELLPVLAYVLPRLGAGRYDHIQMAARVNRFTGGIGASVGLRTAPDDLARQERGFSLHGSALYRNHAALLDILADFLTGLHFEPDHLADLFGQYRASLESRILSAGHLYSIALADAQLSPQGSLRERLSGLSQLAVARRLASLTPQELATTVEHLEHLRDAVFRRGAVNACVTSEEAQLPALGDSVGGLVRSLSADGSREPHPPAKADTTPAAGGCRAVARTAAVPVAYVARVFRTVPFTHPDAPALMVLGNYLRATHIHREVREKGGAYGGRSMSQPENGLFVFMSYRDPQLVATLRAFSSAIDFVLRQKPSERTLTEAILESAGDVDPLLSPDTKGRDRFFSDLAGYTLERRTAFRRQLLAVRADDLVRVAEAYLRDGDAVAAIGGEELITKANAELDGWFEVSPV